MIFKLITVIMIILFGYAIAVQLNDPDPYFWVALYGISLIASLGVLVALPMPGVLWVALGIYVAAIAWLSPNFANTSIEAFAAIGMKGDQEELVRELWGMVICALWTCVLIFQERKYNPHYSMSQ